MTGWPEATAALLEAGGNRDTFERLNLHLTALCVGYLKEVERACNDEPS